MPAVFAHDLYGRNIFMELDREIRDAIRKEKDCFYLGVQGPDVLFYYRPWGTNPINEKGHRYHARPAMEIFAHGVEVMRNTEDPKKKGAIQAYLLGVACHFALDHSLHGEIGRLERETGFTHAEIETELDRRLLIGAEMEPVRSYTACHLKNTEMTRYAVMKVFKEDEKVSGESIFTFKTMERLFINTGEFFKKFVGFVMKRLGCYDKYFGMVMKKDPMAGLDETTELLENMFFEAVPFGVKVVNGLYDSMKKRDPLPSAFYGDFEGNNAN